MSDTREVPIFPILAGSSNNRFSATSRYFNSPQSPIIFGSVCSVLPRSRSSCKVERDASSSGSVSKRLWDASSFRRPAWRKEEDGEGGGRRRRKEGGKRGLFKIMNITEAAVIGIHMMECTLVYPSYSCTRVLIIEYI